MTKIKLTLKGTGASPGSAEGKALPILTPDDLKKIGRRDIVILNDSTPLAIPFIINAAGLIGTATSILCHLSIVAREFRIPCVVGIKDAQARIPAGAKIKLNGSLGVIDVYD